MATQVTEQVVHETPQRIGDAYQLIVPYLPKLIGALAILIVGWLGAVLVACIVRAALRRTAFDRKLAEWFSGEESKSLRVENAIAKGTYYLMLVFVLLAFFDTLGLTRVTESLNGLLGEILTYMPRVLGAALLLVFAWGVATVARFVVRRVSDATAVDEKLATQTALDTGEGESTGQAAEAPALSHSVANSVYWLVFLLFLPAILGTLALPGLLTPVQELVNKLLAFLPNVFAALVILGIGWFAARIVQRIATNLLAAVGTDHLAHRVGLGNAFGQRRLSGVLGLMVYILVLLPVLIASLNALQLAAVTGPATQMLDMVLSAVPALLAAALVILVAYVVGRVIAGLVTSLLTGIGFNRLPAKLGLTQQEEPAEGERTLSEIAGDLLLVATMLFAVMEALPILGFDPLAAMISQFFVFAGRVFMGLAILAVGLWLAHLAARVIESSRVGPAGLLAVAARVSIVVLATAMALRQMGLANEIINSAFTIVLGAIAVAAALAFGLGGREAAGQALEQFLESRRPQPASEPQHASHPPKTEAKTDAPSAPGLPVGLDSQPPSETFSGTGAP